MDSSYLAQAIAQIGQPASASAQGGMSLQQMRQLAEAAKTWRSQHPGQSYLASRFTQAGHSLAALPGQVVGALSPQAQPQPQAQAAPLPGFQQSAIGNGMAKPEYTIPDWARDGTAASDPSNVSYLDLSGMKPYGQHAGAGLGSSKGAAARPGTPQVATASSPTVESILAKLLGGGA